MKQDRNGWKDARSTHRPQHSARPTNIYYIIKTSETICKVFAQTQIHGLRRLCRGPACRWQVKLTLALHPSGAAKNALPMPTTHVKNLVCGLGTNSNLQRRKVQALVLFFARGLGICCLRSPPTFLKIHFQTPLLYQEKRVWTTRKSPKRSGRSRHGIPT